MWVKVKKYTFNFFFFHDIDIKLFFYINYSPILEKNIYPQLLNAWIKNTYLLLYFQLLFIYYYY